jgi:hypothetical protein
MNEGARQVAVNAPLFANVDKGFVKGGAASERGASTPALPRDLARPVRFASAAFLRYLQHDGYV